MIAVVTAAGLTEKASRNSAHARINIRASGMWLLPMAGRLLEAFRS